jgi:hypothetical protein
MIAVGRRATVSFLTDFGIFRTGKDKQGKFLQLQRGRIQSYLSTAL